MKGFAVTPGVVMLYATLCLAAWAQSQNARVGGTVSDASGALAPGVEVRATNDGTGIVASVLSNEAGAYQFASLQPGTYTITATATDVVGNVGVQRVACYVPHDQGK